MKAYLKVGMAAAITLAMVACGGGKGAEIRSKPNTNEGGTTQPAATDDPAAERVEDEPTTTSEAETLATPAAAQASEYVGGNVDPTFAAGEAGELSVVAVGAPDGEESSIPFVVRNNTGGTIYNVAATGKVTNGGQLVGSGSDQGVEPVIVAPGEIAFGYVYFSAAPPAGSTVEISATADKEKDSFMSSVPMIIGAANLVPSDYGAEIVGEVTAPSDIEVGTPVGVFILCVDAGGTLLGSHTGYTDGDASILPGTSATYSVSIYGGECPTYLVASSGYDF